VEDVPRALAMLWKLRELGCRLVIDDFGTGFSSLSYLKQFPIAHSLKMDRTFIEGLGQTVDDTAIVRAVVNMAHSLGLSAVAEGVERGEQVAELRSLGCDQAQGFWFGVPMPAETITALLREGEGVVPHPALRQRPSERHDVAGIEVDGADASRLAIYSLDAYRGDRPGGKRQPR
jgi:EAL domain-containing protein (putative c-di-GMP-specific phosphodiesterase class I)